MSRKDAMHAERASIGQVPRVRPCHELTPEDIDHFHVELCRMRRELAAEVSSLQRLAMSDGDGVLQKAVDPGAPISADSFMWERILALRDIDSKRTLLHHIDAALERLAQKKYGLCVVDQALIPKEVLEELPWASRCVRCVSETH
jgi:RNA polymerase-binding transcription factor DksA